MAIHAWKILRRLNEGTKIFLAKAPSTTRIVYRTKIDHLFSEDYINTHLGLRKTENKFALIVTSLLVVQEDKLEALFLQLMMETTNLNSSLDLRRKNLSG
ncbi:uncharacterized protein PHALS_13812 [Plasmopara halstedii]|uniref:Uncharacterized protein n=1 Tax=Plasmopara halstedii TaxID=4781 RepID=A0A0P1AQG8_PLAHL|nr:uncharacterized protein PHALS_13812 [Plasmopara halstedii]CEG43621.1 hypothetical protein PHALS_13812 [Plasmopara halstedii]|eukprot:XP_024579990.1 hypothetical protein PHALS_13812 [Plasmopara halstedii]